MYSRVLVLMALAQGFAAAQPLASLVDEALRNNREVLAAQKRYEAARQRPAQASSLPDPMVSLGYTSVGGPWPVAGIGREPTANAGIMISQEAPYPGKRQLRGAMAGKEADSAFQEYLGVRLNVIARLKQAYHELHHAVEMASLINGNRELLNGMIELTEARYSVGRAAQQDVFKGQTQLSIFDAQLARTEQDRRTAEIEINALLNRPQGGHIEAPADLEPTPIPATLDELLARARTDAPMLLREQKNVERAQLGVNLARKDYYPDYVVSGGYFNQGGMAPMWEVRVDFKLPAYFWRKQRAGVAEQAASLSEARRNYEAADTSIQAKIREEYLAAETALKLVDLYRKSAIPQSQLALESSRASYETGAMDFLPVFSNFMNVVDYEMAYHEQVLRFHTAVARLEELTGTELLP